MNVFFFFFPPVGVFIFVLVFLPCVLWRSAHSLIFTGELLPKLEIEISKKKKWQQVFRTSLNGLNTKFKNLLPNWNQSPNVTKFDNFFMKKMTLLWQSIPFSLSFFHFEEIFAFKKKDGQDTEVRKNNSNNRQITIYLVFIVQ